MQLDQILGLAARGIPAVHSLIHSAEPESRVGDDEADVESQLRPLNTGDGAPFVIPDFALWRVSV